MTVPRIQPSSIKSTLWIRLGRSGSRGVVTNTGNVVGEGTFASDAIIRRVPILPVRSIVYFLISVAIVACGLLVVDKLVSVVEQMGDLSSEAWRADNQRINQNNFKKNLATTQNPLWRSRGFDQLGLLSPSQAQLNPKYIDPATTCTTVGSGLAMNQAMAQTKLKHRRILVMGDSFIWGDGYSNMNNTWWRALQRELVLRGYDDVEVFGAGMCGWSTHDQVDAIQTVVDEVKPDAIIWGFVTNDPDEKLIKLDLTKNNAPQAASATTGKAGNAKNEPAVQDDVLVNLRDQLNQAREKKTNEESDDPTLAYSYAEWERKLFNPGPSLDAYDKTIQRVAQFQKSSGIPAFVMTLPMLAMQKSYRKYYDVVGPMFESAGLTWYDILPEFINTYPQDQQEFGGILHWGINPANGHPGTAATHFYAKCAAGYLEAHFPSALGPKSDGPDVGPEALSSSHIVINDWQPWFLQIEPIKAQSTEPGAMTWRIHMPEDDDKYTVTLPLDVPAVLLSFDMPVRLKRIEIGEVKSGTLRKTSVWASWWNPKTGYDDNMQTFPLEPKDGKRVEWLVRGNAFANNVDALRIRAGFVKGTKPEDRVIDVTLVPVE